jgi:hypothetical protein
MCTAILTYLQENRIVSFVKGPLAGKLVDEILERVRKSAQVLQTCVEHIRDEKLADLHSIASHNKTQVQAIRQNTKNTEIGIREISDELVDVAATVQSMSGQVNNIEGQVQEILRKHERMFMREKAESDGRDAQTGLFRFLYDYVRGKHNLLLGQRSKSTHCFKVRIQEEVQRSRTPIRYSAFLSLPELLKVLSVPHMKATEDLDYMLRQGKNFDVAAQGQARCLLQTEQFQGWFSSRNSDLLLVDGNADSFGSSRISPMSFLCATLVLTLLNNRPAISLNFFCGQHVASDDELKGPNGLIRSLIAQLLLTGRTLSLDFIDSRIYREDLESHTQVALCHTFQQLVKQLPVDTLVFCVIDGVSLYERTDWRGDLSFVVDRLSDLVKDERLQPTFKLLMTSPYASKYIHRRIAPYQHVVLRSGTADGRTISQRSVWTEVSRSKMPSKNPFRSSGPQVGSDDDDESSEEYN